MSAELPLSTRIRLALNPSIISMMTKGLSCGCFTPLASSSKNRISIFVRLLCFKGCIPWMLFTSLCWDFLRDLKNPPMDGPLAIVFISLITFYGWLYDLSSSIGGFSNFSLQSSLDQLDSPLFTKFCNLPFQINSSICSFKSLQSSIMVVIFMEMEIFPLVSYIGRGMKWFQPLEVMIFLNLH